MALQRVPPKNLAFLLPRDHSRYTSFRLGLEDSLGKSLPEKLGPLPPRVGTGVFRADLWGLLYFDDQDKPVMRSIIPQGFWIVLLSGSLSRPTRTYYESMFRPLLRRNHTRGFPLPTLFGLFIVISALPVWLAWYAWQKAHGRNDLAAGRYARS